MSAPAWPVFLVAAELLPPEITQPGGSQPGGGLGNQLTPILAAALLVVVPVLLIVAFSHRKKRKRKVHLPRNPTLAETGGLPPRRVGE